MSRATRSAQGFTLIEIMIVVAVISIVATIALPNFLSARGRANETAAVTNLKQIRTAQAQFQSGVYVDQDADGIGEFGFFRELGGAIGVRTSPDGSTTGEPVERAPLSYSFTNLDTNATTERTGYKYMMLLPDATGHAVRESASGAFDGAVDANLAETAFGAYAWPAGYARTGNRTFFVNLAGDVLGTEWAEYSDDNFHAVLVDGAAFQFGGGPDGSITGVPAIGTYGRDLNWWTPVK